MVLLPSNCNILYPIKRDSDVKSTIGAVWFRVRWNVLGQRVFSLVKPLGAVKEKLTIRTLGGVTPNRPGKCSGLKICLDTRQWLSAQRTVNLPFFERWTVNPCPGLCKVYTFIIDTEPRPMDGSVQPFLASSLNICFTAIPSGLRILCSTNHTIVCCTFGCGTFSVNSEYFCILGWMVHNSLKKKTFIHLYIEVLLAF